MLHFCAHYVGPGNKLSLWPSSQLVHIPVHSFRATDSKVRFHVKSRRGGAGGLDLCEQIRPACSDLLE
jgi:hypothetical protein